MGKKKLEHIQNVQDREGNLHSVLIYRENGERTFHHGNQIFKTMKEAKDVILNDYEDLYVEGDIGRGIMPEVKKFLKEDNNGN